jgi:hypothetical protein
MQLLWSNHLYIVEDIFINNLFINQCIKYLFIKF